MRPYRILMAAFLMAGATLAQDSPISRALRLRFGQAETRAIANFRSADSIERNLRAEGNTLHPNLMVLRLRIASALDESEAALAKGEWDTARESIGRAEGLIDKFTKKLGGD